MKAQHNWITWLNRSEKCTVCGTIKKGGKIVRQGSDACKRAAAGRAAVEGKEGLAKYSG